MPRGAAAPLETLYHACPDGKYAAENNAPGSHSLMGTLAELFEGAPIDRLIIDDYDMLNLASNDYLIPAAFTWFISATRRVKQTACVKLTDLPDRSVAQMTYADTLRACLVPGRQARRVSA